MIPPLNQLLMVPQLHFLTLSTLQSNFSSIHTLLQPDHATHEPKPSEPKLLPANGDCRPGGIPLLDCISFLLHVCPGSSWQHGRPAGGAL